MTDTPRFEDRLLEQLSAVVAARPAPDRLAAAARVRPPRGRLAFAGATVTAAVAAVAVFGSTGDHTTAAFAVTPRPSGGVTVTIRSLADAAGLQERLRAAGIPAVVDYDAGGGGAAAGCEGGLPGGGQVGGASTGGGPRSLQRSESGAGGGKLPSLSTSGPALPPAGAGQRMSSSVRVGPGGEATFSLDPGTLEPGQKVFITTSTGALSSISIGIGTTRPAPCPAP